MQPKSKPLVFIIVVLLISNLVMLYFFIGRREDKKPHEVRKPFMVESLQKEVGFNSEQIAQLEVLRKKQKERMKPLFDSLRNAKLALYKTAGLGQQDSMVQAAADQVGASQKAIELQMLSHFNEIRTLCTPAQQKAYDTLVSNITKKMISGSHGKGRQKADSAKQKSSE